MRFNRKLEWSGWSEFSGDLRQSRWGEGFLGSGSAPQDAALHGESPGRWAGGLAQGAPPRTVDAQFAAHRYRGGGFGVCPADRRAQRSRRRPCLEPVVDSRGCFAALRATERLRHLLAPLLGAFRASYPTCRSCIWATATYPRPVRLSKEFAVQMSPALFSVLPT